MKITQWQIVVIIGSLEAKIELYKTVNDDGTFDQSIKDCKEIIEGLEPLGDELAPSFELTPSV